MKKLIKRFGAYIGYDIRKKNIHDDAFCAGRIKLLGNPNTIIDVGVNIGTFEFYNAFPDKNIVCIDPITELHKAAIQHIRAKYPGVICVSVAAGERSEEKEINYEPSSPGRTSLLGRTALTKCESPSQKLTIQVKRLDDIIRELNLLGPYGIKIDTEGYELQVLKGAEGLFSNVEFIIAEVSIAKRFENSYSFEELIIYMDDHGFRVTDMLSYLRCDPIGTRYLDLVFKRKP